MGHIYIQPTCATGLSAGAKQIEGCVVKIDHKTIGVVLLWENNSKVIQLCNDLPKGAVIYPQKHQNGNLSSIQRNPAHLVAKGCGVMHASPNWIRRISPRPP